MPERCSTRACRCVVIEDGLCRSCLAGEGWRQVDAQPELPRSLDWLSLDLLEATAAEPDWEREGACYQKLNTPVFYVERGDSSAEAKALCRTCPAVYRCLRFVLDVQSSAQDHGIWGRTSAKERRKIHSALANREAIRELTERSA